LALQLGALTGRAPLDLSFDDMNPGRRSGVYVADAYSPLDPKEIMTLSAGPDRTNVDVLLRRRRHRECRGSAAEAPKKVVAAKNDIRCGRMSAVPSMGCPAIAGARLDSDVPGHEIAAR
jgi:hypothetical protein